MFFLYKSFAGCSLKSHITPSLRAFPYCSNLRQFSIKFLIVRKRGQDAIDFVAIASSLRATNGRRAVGNTNRLKAVSLVHGRKNPHSPVHLYFPSSSALTFSPPCGSCYVFELTHFINKYALNKCSLKVRSASSRTAVFISSAK